MAVFRDVTINWAGNDYVVTPSNRLLRRIEGEGISFTHMISRIANGEPPISEVSFVIAEFLKSAGAKVTEDDIYAEIMAALSRGDGDAFANLAVSVVEAISPQEPDAKKPADLAASRPKAPVRSKK